ncbi:hypothetical protein ACHQM5_011688 [Ranunculus cassubicifolius]
MDYDFRNNKAPSQPPYDSRIPMYKPTSNPASASPHISNFYPRVGQSNHPVNNPPPPHPSRNFNLHSVNNPPPSSSSSGLGIRVMIKPEYRITPPPQLSPLVGEIPRSTFQFDFDFEKKVIAEAEKGNQNWPNLENPSLRPTESTSSMNSTADPVVSKYIASGLSREAVPLAVANYGDNPTKVREFVDGYNLLREMGFSSSKVAEALAMYDNDTDKALAYFLNSATS